MGIAASTSARSAAASAAASREAPPRARSHSAAASSGKGSAPTSRVSVRILTPGSVASAVTISSAAACGISGFSGFMLKRVVLLRGRGAAEDATGCDVFVIAPAAKQGARDLVPRGEEIAAKTVRRR